MATCVPNITGQEYGTKTGEDDYDFIILLSCESIVELILTWSRMMVVVSQKQEK